MFADRKAQQRGCATDHITRTVTRTSSFLFLWTLLPRRASSTRTVLPSLPALPALRYAPTASSFVPTRRASLRLAAGPDDGRRPGQRRRPRLHGQDEDDSGEGPGHPPGIGVANQADGEADLELGRATSSASMSTLAQSTDAASPSARGMIALLKRADQGTALQPGASPRRPPGGGPPEERTRRPRRLPGWLDQGQAGLRMPDAT